MPFQKGHKIWKGKKRPEVKQWLTSFKKGHKPWNKNKKGIHLSPETEFKKRELMGNTRGFKKGQIPWNKGLKGFMAGEKNPSWKGGITPLVNQIRNHFKSRQWRCDVFERDNYTCQLCNQKGKYLEADHYPKRFSKILEEYNIRTLKEALNCEELWNINNGRTLCLKCHNSTKGKIK